MKVLAWMTAVIALGAVGACSSGSGTTGSVFSSSSAASSSGAGGHGGDSTFSTTSNASTGSSTNGAGGGNGDCYVMPDHQTCVTCVGTKNPTGAMLYNTFNDCLYCSECYNVCDGKAKGCAAPPANQGACDGAGPDPAACGDFNGGCIKCAYAGACKAAYDACTLNPLCQNYGTDILSCPK
jgi:hypothetical protein